MGKVIGIFLILCGCAGLLGCWYLRQRRRQAVVEELIRLFAQWEYSLEREKMRLFDFLEQYGSKDPRVEHFLAELLWRLRTLAEPSGACAWRRQLTQCREELLLDATVWEILLAAENAFFGKNSRESSRCAKAARGQLEQWREHQREEFVRRQKVYMPVGMLGGVLLVILLI